MISKELLEKYPQLQGFAEIESEDLEKYQERLLASYKFNGANRAPSFVRDFVPYYLLTKEVANAGEMSIMEDLLSIDEIADNIAINNNKFLRCAVKSGNLALVDRLLEYQDVRDNIDAKDNEALYWVGNIWDIKPEHIDILKRLLEYPGVRKNIASNDNRVLHSAILRAIEANKKNDPIQELYLSVIHHLLTFKNVQTKITESMWKNLNDLGISKNDINPTFQSRLLKTEYAGEIPEYLICPISREIMDDPITVSSGVTYDRQSLKSYFVSKGNPITLECPITRLPIRQNELSNQPSITIKQFIESFVSEKENDNRLTTTELFGFFKAETSQNEPVKSHTETLVAPNPGVKHLDQIGLYVATKLQEEDNELSRELSTTVSKLMDAYKQLETAIQTCESYSHDDQATSMKMIDGITETASKLREDINRLNEVHEAISSNHQEAPLNSIDSLKIFIKNAYDLGHALEARENQMLEKLERSPGNTPK